MPVFPSRSVNANSINAKQLVTLISSYGAATVVVAVPFAAYAISVLYSFYGIGGSFHDAGWSAYLIHDADLQIHDPPCVDGGMSWFNSQFRHYSWRLRRSVIFSP